MRRYIGVVAVATVLLLSGCGSANEDGGVPAAEPTESSCDYDCGSKGIDHQEIETYDTNVEIQAVEVDGIKCVIAVRNDIGEFELVCP